MSPGHRFAAHHHIITGDAGVITVHFHIGKSCRTILCGNLYITTPAADITTFDGQGRCDTAGSCSITSTGGDAYSPVNGIDGGVILDAHGGTGHVYLTGCIQGAGTGIRKALTYEHMPTTDAYIILSGCYRSTPQICITPADFHIPFPCHFKRGGINHIVTFISFTYLNCQSKRSIL